MFVSKKTYEKQIESLNDALVSLSTRMDLRMLDAKTEIEGRIQELFEAALQADRKKRYDSSEPYVEIISENFSSEGGIQLRLDWNAPFIKYLKENGFSGPSDEAIVDSWLISLSNERVAEGGSEYK